MYVESCNQLQMDNFQYKFKKNTLTDQESETQALIDK